MQLGCSKSSVYASLMRTTAQTPDRSLDLFAVRSLLFLPASNSRAIAKAREAGADLVILDLEDAVKPDDKRAARAAAVEAVGSAGRCRWRSVSTASGPSGTRSMSTRLPDRMPISWSFPGRSPLTWCTGSRKRLRSPFSR